MAVIQLGQKIFEAVREGLIDDGIIELAKAVSPHGLLRCIAQLARHLLLSILIAWPIGCFRRFHTALKCPVFLAVGRSPTEQAENVVVNQGTKPCAFGSSPYDTIDQEAAPLPFFEAWLGSYD